ncbi:very short patch repair endonuclease [Pseudidiomarina terrestris]|uniref:very short patch repair endonuclease n=1 Tax=Pseudidiomarina terrestris TaxID=2820060 RepID=UPI00264B3A11|nr:DNA mismatch endonuclease Vsr [Pseudidiomarina sp. 1ASP75-5]
MVDVHSKQTRSKNMRAIKGKNTAIELKLRSRLHRAGLRYRVHTKQIPGRPDVYFRAAQTAIFINGCFWHGHQCHLFSVPKTRTSFWINKIQENQVRDHTVIENLLPCDIRALVVWECALKGPARLDLDYIVVLIQRFLSHHKPLGIISSTGMELHENADEYKSHLKILENINAT